MLDYILTLNIKINFPDVEQILSISSPFSSSKFRLFYNATFFSFCIIHILHTECAKILV
jgi:hypothetical protein